MTNEEAALILHPDTTIFALDRADNGYYGTRVDVVEEACKMGADALRNGEKAIEILKTIDWVGSGAKGMIQDAIDLLEGAGSDTRTTRTGSDTCGVCAK